MSALSVPNAILNGATLDAAEVEENFTAIETWGNGQFPVVTADLDDGSVTPTKMGYANCRVHYSGTVTTTPTAVTFTEDEDGAAFFTSGSSVVIPASGLYLIGVAATGSASNVESGGGGGGDEVTAAPFLVGTALTKANVVAGAGETVYGASVLVYALATWAVTVQASVLAANTSYTQRVDLFVTRVG